MTTKNQGLSLGEFLSLKGNPPIKIILSEGTYRIPKPQPQKLSRKGKYHGEDTGDKQG
jgi:hypothetical protein